MRVSVSEQSTGEGMRLYTLPTGSMARHSAVVSCRRRMWRTEEHLCERFMQLPIHRMDP